MSSLADARAACAPQAALVQRARLMDLIWSDLHGERRSVAHRALPERLADIPESSAMPLATYAADLICCADDVWRVVRDDVGRHSAASVLQAPLLAVFLPELCRLLLGQPLLLPSVPVWWLGDGATKRMLAEDPRRFWLRDGLDATGGPVSLTKMPAPHRLRLQAMVDADPTRFIAGREPVWSVPTRRVMCNTALTGLE